MEALSAGVEAAKRKNYKQAYELWLPLAREGNPYAQVNIGYLYLKGLYVEQNQNEANWWFSEAQKSNNTDINDLVSVISEMGNIEVYFELNKGFG